MEKRLCFSFSFIGRKIAAPYLLSSLSLPSASEKMAKSLLNPSSPPFLPASNDELDSLSNSELISFLESSFRRSEFISVARILKSREELGKAEALKDLTSKLSHLEAKNGSLEKELLALRSNEVVEMLEREIIKEKSRYLLLRGSYEKMDKLAQEKIKALMEEIEKERAKCLRLEEQLARNARIAEVDSWKSKYSLLEAWILRFLENNPRLIQKVRKQDMNKKKQDVDFFSINKAAGELLRSNRALDKKESFFTARAKSKAAIDISSSDIELVCDSFEDKRPKIKYSTKNDDKNCIKRKFLIAQASGDGQVLALDDEDDVKELRPWLTEEGTLERELLERSKVCERKEKVSLSVRENECEGITRLLRASCMLALLVTLGDELVDPDFDEEEATTRAEAPPPPPIQPLDLPTLPTLTMTLFNDLIT
ncbi:hypothetical protein IEQ34_011293 [Dendrobium chrysotoxum]|uniref:Uncharacterized protein n=1 Tax=Dendrobium chrysotoxum TaxID=161865 RepID=A0AAV7GX41_DENCH|nr:hypothetical protein IEQ34_011293 [Dendrobium chrysotoxum]